MLQTQNWDLKGRDKYVKKFDWTREQCPPNSNGIYGLLYPKPPPKEKAVDFGNLRYNGPPSWYLKDEFLNSKLGVSKSKPKEEVKTLRKLQAYQDSDGTWRYPWQHTNSNSVVSKDILMAFKPVKRSSGKYIVTSSVPQYEQNLWSNCSPRMKKQITISAPRPSERLSTRKIAFTGIDNQGCMFHQLREPYSSRMEPHVAKRHHFFYDIPKTKRTHFSVYPTLNVAISQLEV